MSICPGSTDVQTLRQIMKRHPLPIIMFSSATTEQAEITLRALRMGAIDFVAKPKGNLTANIRYLTHELIAKIKGAAKARFQNGIDHTGQTSSIGNPVEHQDAVASSSRSALRPSERIPLFVIGCSTGGPRALEKIIPGLPHDFPGAIGIVQHMPEPFSRVFAKNLAQISPMRVKTAENGEPFRPGQVLMAPGDANLRVLKQDHQIIATVERPAERNQGWMSSIDLFFCSAARTLAGQNLWHSPHGDGPGRGQRHGSYQNHGRHHPCPG